MAPPGRPRRASADVAALKIATQSAEQSCPNRARSAAAANAVRDARRVEGDEVKRTSAEIARPRRGPSSSRAPPRAISADTTLPRASPTSAERAAAGEEEASEPGEAERHLREPRRARSGASHTLVPIRPRRRGERRSLRTSPRAFLSAHPSLSIPTHLDAFQLRF